MSDDVDVERWLAVDDADRADLRATSLQAEVDALKAGRDAVLELHRPIDALDPDGPRTCADGCGAWPCPTARALGEDVAAQPPAAEQLRLQCYDAWDRGYDWGAGDGPRRLNPYRDEDGGRG